MNAKEEQYILENASKKSIQVIARDLGIKERKVKKFIEQRRQHIQPEHQTSSHKIFFADFFKDKPGGFITVICIATLVLLAKLLLSYNVYGTNDMTYWIGFADTIKTAGTFKIYSLIPIYNHPPLMSWVLKLVNFFQAATGLGFNFLFRLLPIFADYASVFTIWAILKKYGSAYKTIICVLCVINPINFLVSGFHGNTDPIFGFFILLAIYFVEADNCIVAGLLYGLSMCIKIVPAILAPAFLFYIQGLKKRMIFMISAAIVPLAVFIPYLLADPLSVTKNIFQYSGLKGIWGIGHILSSIFNNEGAGSAARKLAFDLFKAHALHAHLFVLVIITLLSFYFMNKRRLNLAEGVFLVYATFLAITPGFGVQYLTWPSSFGIIIMPILGTLYAIMGGIFLYRVYAYWGGTVSPYYANSDVVGQWIGFEKTLDLIIWFIIVTMLVKFIWHRRR